MIDTRLGDPKLLRMVEAWAVGVMARPYNEVIERNASAFIERWMLARKASVPTFVASRSRTPTIIGASYDDPAPVPSEVENLYLHHYLRDDPEDLHDHPWGNVSFVIRGYFVELTPEGRFTRLPGDIAIRAPHEQHAIVEVEPGSLSLFATAPKVQEWGFFPAGEKVHHSEYAAFRAARAAPAGPAS